MPWMPATPSAQSWTPQTPPASSFAPVEAEGGIIFGLARFGTATFGAIHPDWLSTNPNTGTWTNQ